jgi:type IV secretory pathway VirB10-like protein
MARTLTQLFPPMPGVRKLRRPLIIWTTAILFGLFAIFLLASLKKERLASGQYEEVQVVADEAPVHTESFSGLPASYAEIWKKSQSAVIVPQEEQRAQACIEPRAHGQPTAVIGPPLQNLHVADKTIEDQEREKALRSAIFFTAIAAKAVDAAPGAVPAPETALPDLAMPRQAFDVLGDVLKTTQQGESSETRANQKAKQAFLKAKAGEQAAVYLAHRIQDPLSPYQLMAGTVLPAVLVSGINSDLPGQIIAQIRENVYDTVTGGYLLVPQGAKLIGSYDNMIAWGQDKVMVVWSRLIFPNGSSIVLDNMEGSDLAGYAGFHDRVNNHYLKLGVAILFSSVLSVGATQSHGDIRGYHATWDQQLGANVGEDVNKTGQKIVERQLNVPPTIEIRPGYPFNVMVNKDVILREYRP